MQWILLALLFITLAGPSWSEGGGMGNTNVSPAEYLDKLPKPPKVKPGLELIQQWSAVDRPSGGMLKDENLAYCRKAGMTSIQNYVHWSEVEPEPGKFDWSYYDETVLKAEKQGLKFVPFIIAGPYHSTPKWFRESKESVPARCLEHGTDSPIQSIWNPHLRKHVDTFLKAFAEHYRPMGVLESIELGISGNWGESIYPAQGGFHWPKDGHQHYGYWCGDSYAQEDFRRWLSSKYKTIDKLNEEWHSNFGTFTEIETFLQRKAPSSEAWLDQLDWYFDSMNQWSEFWLATARKYFPTEPIYLCTGGDGAPALGADFAAQAKLCTKYHAGLRITNMEEDFARNFALTRLVGTSCRFYGSYFTTEEAGFNKRTGVVARIFDLATCGARGGYFKTICASHHDFAPTDCAIAMAENISVVKENQPVIDTAILWPSANIILDGSVVYQLHEAAVALRDYADFDYIDENMVRDGALADYKFLVLPVGHKMEERASQKIAAWVEQGGVLIATRPWERVKLPGQPPIAESTPLFSRDIPSEIARGKGFVALIPFDPKNPSPVSDAIHNTNGAFPWKGLPMIDGKADRIYASQTGNRILRYDSKKVHISEVSITE